MAQLKNKRRELFCQMIASGKTSSVAYQLCGFRANPSNSSNYPKKHPEIQARIEELLKIKEDEAICKREECAKVLSKMIRSKLDTSDMVKQRAIQTLSQLLNWQTTHIITENKVSTMSDTELEKILQEAK